MAAPPAETSSLPLHPVAFPVKACCQVGGGLGAGPEAAVLALVGPPNTGKSTLFNALTGARVTMGNWPGTTVEVSRGVWKAAADSAEPGHGDPAGRLADLTLVDLPGAYSLDAHSPDEALTRDLLVSVPPAERPDLCVVTCDASRLASGLYLVAQLREQPLPVLVALTMLDVAEASGITIDTEALSAALGCPVVAIDPRRRIGLTDLAALVRQRLAAPAPEPRYRPADPDPVAAEDDRFAWIAAAVATGTSAPAEPARTWSDRVDRWVTAPVLGPLIFLGVMWAVFQVTTSVAAPLQDFLDNLFSGPLSAAASGLLGRAGLGGTWVEGLVVDGLIAGVGMLLTFVPLMALMFVLLALLEDSGYLARAAVVTDQLMRSIGLPGKAFLPLIVGFGCNVPAIAATRILPGARQRVLTALLVPFTSCTARLTVFVMIGSVFFGDYAGTAVFFMYVVSIHLVVLAGLVLRRTLWRTMGAEPLIIDLPAYQVPTLRLTAAVTWVRLKGFLRTASGIIVAAVCGVWLLQSVPAVPGAGFGEVAVADSVYGMAARTVAPIFTPAGFGQWQATSALAVGFVAKEAVISSWAQTYAVADEADAATGLGGHLLADFTASSGGHPVPAALAFMIFLLAYTPCVATIAAQRREIGARWTLFGVAIQFSSAWLLAVLVFQIGRLLL